MRRLACAALLASASGAPTPHQRGDTAIDHAGGMATMLADEPKHMHQNRGADSKKDRDWPDTQAESGLDSVTVIDPLSIGDKDSNCEAEETFILSADGCFCSVGDCASLTKCIATAMCNGQSGKSGKGDDDGGRRVLAQQAPPSPTTVAGSAIVLYLTFNSSEVKTAYVGKFDPVTGWPAGYQREYNRVENLVRSARAVNTTLPMYLMVGGERFSAAEEKLTALGVHVTEMAPVRPPTWASSFHKQTFNKLGALNATQFEKVVLMDNDMVMLRNIDGLVNAPAPAAVFHPGLCKETKKCEFNSGLMVLQPSAAEAAKVTDLLETMGKRFSHDADGGDQEVWSAFYKNNMNELPISYNAHRALLMDDAEWRSVHVIHAMALMEPVKRSPAWLDQYVNVYNEGKIAGEQKRADEEEDKNANLTSDSGHLSGVKSTGVKSTGLHGQPQTGPHTTNGALHTLPNTRSNHHGTTLAWTATTLLGAEAAEMQKGISWDPKTRRSFENAIGALAFNA